MKHLFCAILVCLAAAGVLFPSSAAASSEADLFNEGAMHLKMNRVDAAIDAFTRVIEMNPDNARAYMNRGEAYILIGQYNQAIRDFAKTEQLHPGFRGLYSNVGVVWYYRKDCKKAIEYFNREIRQYPDSHIAFFNRGLCYLELEDYDKALNDMSKTLDLKPDLYWAICYKGDILEKTHNIEQAKTAYEVALALDPKEPYARNRLAGLHEVVPDAPEVVSSEILDIDEPMRADKEIVPKVLVSHGPFIIEEPLSGFDEIGPEVVPSTAPYIEEPVAAHQEAFPDGPSSGAFHAEAAAPPPDYQAVAPEVPSAIEAETQVHVAAIPDVVPQRPAPPEVALYYIQTGAFLRRENAERQRRSLVEKQFDATVFSKFIQGKTYHIVRVGRFVNMSDARTVMKELEEEAGISAFIQKIDH